MSIKGLKVIDLKVVTDYKLLLIENLSESFIRACLAILLSLHHVAKLYSTVTHINPKRAAN